MLIPDVSSSLGERRLRAPAFTPRTCFIAAGVVAATASLAFGLTRDRTMQAHTTTSSERRAAYQGVDGFSHRTIEVQAPAQLRLTPEFEDGDQDLANNHYRRVQEDETLIITAPLIDQSRPGWIGFTEPAAQPRLESPEAQARQTLWINLAKLVDQGLARELPRNQELLSPDELSASTLTPRQ